LTIFLRLNWMNKNNMAEILINELNQRNIQLDGEEAVKIAKSIRRPMWDWHIYIGYVLTGLYFLRLLLMAIKGAAFKSPFNKLSTLKEKIQSWTYILFYILLGATLITGLLIIWGPEAYEHTVEEIHVLALYWLLGYMFVHLMGIVIGELGEKKGIVSKMINGKGND
jgi:Ni,Fe-hydrogenase I cytochrome b subunit